MIDDREIDLPHTERRPGSQDLIGLTGYKSQ